MNQIEESQWTESKLADEIAEIFSTFKEKSRSIAGDYYTNTILDAAVNKGILKIYLKHFSKETLFHLNKRTKKETQRVIRKAIRLRLHQVMPSPDVDAFSIRIKGVILLN